MRGEKQPPRPARPGTELRYPLLLVHGMGQRDDSRFYKYWYGLPDFLRFLGAEVSFSQHDALASVADSAAQLKARVGEVLARSGAEKINLLAHSKGGLDARELLRDAACRARVASLTTFSTPHRGSSLAADILRRHSPFALRLLSRVSDRLYTWMGDRQANLDRLARELLPEACAARNAEPRELEGLQFMRCYAGEYKAGRSPHFYNYMNRKLLRLEGANDGVVSVASALYGEGTGLLSSPAKRGVSHVALIGSRGLAYPVRLNGGELRPLSELYRALLRDLAAAGC